MLTEERILAELQEIKGLLRTMLARAPSDAPESLPTLAALGWSRREAALVRSQLASFEDDWNAPGMEAYDQL
jgi:hypothetical protein